MLVLAAVLTIFGLVVVDVYKDTNAARRSSWRILTVCLGKAFTHTVDWDVARQLFCYYSHNPADQDPSVQSLHQVYPSENGPVDINLMCQFFVDAGRHTTWVVYVSSVSILTGFVIHSFAGMFFFENMESLENNKTRYTLFTIASVILSVCHATPIIFWFVTFDHINATGLEVQVADGFYMLLGSLMCHWYSVGTLLLELVVVVLCSTSDAVCVEVDLLLSKAKEQGMTLNRVSLPFRPTFSHHSWDSNGFGYNRPGYNANRLCAPASTGIQPYHYDEPSTNLYTPAATIPKYTYLPRPIDVANIAYRNNL